MVPENRIATPKSNRAAKAANLDGTEVHQMKGLTKKAMNLGSDSGCPTGYNRGKL
jgi:hypothetical protein